MPIPLMQQPQILDPLHAGRGYMLSPQSLQEALQTAMMGVQAQYMPQMTQAELAYKQAQTPELQARTQGQMIENQYKPEDYATQFALRRAQGQQDIANAGHLNAETPWVGRKAQSEIDEAKARVQEISEKVKKSEFERQYPGTTSGGITGAIALQNFMLDKQAASKLAGTPGVTTNRDTNYDLNAGNNLPFGAQQRGQINNLLGSQSTQNLTNSISQMASQGAPQMAQWSPVAGALMKQFGNETAQSRPTIPGVGQLPAPLHSYITSALQAGPKEASNSLDMLSNFIKTSTEKTKIVSDWMRAKTENTPWQSLPARDKGYTLATLRAAGYDDTESAQLLSHGAKQSDLLLAHGFDPKNPPAPANLPTNAILTQQESANLAQAGIEAIEPELTAAIAPFSSRWNGRNLEQLYDVIKGKEPAKVAKYLAAGAIQLEMSGMRIRSAGLPITEKVLDEMVDKSLGKIESSNLGLSPETYRLTQKELTKFIRKMNSAKNKRLSQMSTHFSEDEATPADEGGSGITDAEISAYMGAE